MKTIKFLFACLFAVAIGVGSYAFKTDDQGEKVKKETRGAGSYRYIVDSDEIDDLKEPLHWEPVTEEDDPCAEGEAIPCFVVYTGSDFDAFLSSATYNSLMAIAPEKKPAD